MSPLKRLQEVEELFQELINEPPARRTAHLKLLSGENPVLGREVELLLDAHADVEHQRFFDEDPIGCLGAEAVSELLLADTRSLSHSPAAPRSMSSPLAQFGDYELLEVIGRGGMGIVHKARQISLNRIVALKTILTGRFASRDDVERFRREAQAAGRLRHPGIVTVHEVGEHDSHHFFTMPYVAGTTLREKLASYPMKPREAAALVRDVAAAVHYAHRHGIVHRDLKPSNILIDEQSRPCVTDFGLAKEPRPDDEPTIDNLGTPGYMAPEQSAGAVTPQVDVYALGAILYAALVGRPPFVAATPRETLHQSMRNDPASARRLNSAVPRDLDTICTKCLRREPSRRFASAEALAQDLDRFLKHEPIRARPASIFYRGGRFLGRHKTASALSGIAILAVFAAVIGLTTGLLRSQFAREVEIASLLSQSRSNRISRSPGQRYKSLAGLRKATAMWSRPADSRLLEFRNEAIACLSLVDLKVATTWQAESVFACAVDAAGRRYACADPVGNIVIRDITASEESLQLPTPGRQCFALRFGPEGKHVGVVYSARNATEKPLLKVWSITDPRPTIVIESAVHHDAWAFDQQETQVALCNDAGQLAMQQLAAPESPAQVLDDVWINRIAFHPTRDELAVSTTDLSDVRVYDFRQRVLLYELPHPDMVRGVAWRPDGNLLAAACSDRIHVWEMPSRTQRAILQGHESIVSDVAFSERGTLLASASWGEQFRLWDPWTGRQLLSAAGLPWIRFCNDDAKLAGAWVGEEVGIWNLEDGHEYRVLHSLERNRERLAEYPDRGTWCVAYGPHDLLASCNIEGVRLWCPPKSDEPICILPVGHTTSCVFRPDGSALLTSGRAGVYYWPLNWERVQDGVVRVGPPGRLRLRPSFIPHRLHAGGNPFSIGIAEYDGSRCALTDLRSVLSTREVRSESKFDAVAISPDGKWIATGTYLTDPGGTTIYDAESGRAVKELATGDAWPFFSPDGKWLVTGAAMTYQFWAVETWKKLHAIPRAESTSRGVLAFSPDGTLLAAAHSMRQVKLFRTASGQEVATLATPDQRVVTSLAFNNDATLLAAACQGRVIKVWDLGRIRKTLAGMRLDWNLEGAAAGSADAEQVHRVVVADDQEDSSRVEYPPAFVAAPEAMLGGTTASEWVAQASDHALAGRWSESLACFERAIAASPDNARNWHYCGLLYLQLGKHDRYQQLCSDMNRRFATAERRRDRILVAVTSFLGQLAESDLDTPLSAARSLVAEIPQSHAHQSMLGAVLFRLGKYEEAAERFATAVASDVNGGNPADWLFMAMTEQKRGNPARAQELLEQSTDWFNQHGFGSSWSDAIKYKLLLSECEQTLGDVPD